MKLVNVSRKSIEKKMHTTFEDNCDFCLSPEWDTNNKKSCEECFLNKITNYFVTEPMARISKIIKRFEAKTFGPKSRRA